MILSLLLFLKITLFPTSLCGVLVFDSVSRRLLLRRLRLLRIYHTSLSTPSFTHHLCQPPSFTHHLCHTPSFIPCLTTIFHTPSLSSTIFHTPSFTHHLCQPPSFTQHLSHTIFVNQHLSHTIFVTYHLCQPPSFTHHLCQPASFTHHLCQPPSFTHHLSHTIFTSLSTTIFHPPSFFNHHLSHTIFHTLSLRHPHSFCVAGVALMALGWLWWHAWRRLWVELEMHALCV